MMVHEDALSSKLDSHMERIIRIGPYLSFPSFFFPVWAGLAIFENFLGGSGLS
jgi:hypothetical protein